MNNILLFERINASSATPHWEIETALGVAQWLIMVVPVGLVLGWLRGDDATRMPLLELLLAVLFALGIAQLVAHAWPQPRPFMLHLGTAWLAHSPDPGLPSDHVIVFWALACAAMMSRRLRPWSRPLLGLGLLVGWSRVFLGVHFPLDVAAALPVGLGGALFARSLRPWLQPLYAAAVRAGTPPPAAWCARSLLRCISGGARMLLLHVAQSAACIQGVHDEADSTGRRNTGLSD